MASTDLIKSPQERALEALIWDRLSAFWTNVYDPSDKDALNAMYDAFLKSLDAEYVRLFQIDDNKSLDTAPIFTQRRWVRFDLNRYATLKKWFRFLVAGDPAITTGGVAGSGTGEVATDDGTGIPGGSNESSCGATVTNHTKHWHIAFPWKMVNDPAKSMADRQTVELSFPIFLSLTKVWKLDVTGTGTLLAPGIDYVIGSNGKSIRIIQAAPSHRYEMEVAFDLGDPVFEGQAPAMRAAIGFQTPGTLLLPPGFGNGLPVHVMIVRNPPAMSVSPADGTVVGTATNTLFYTTERIFVPFAYGHEDGVTYRSTTQVQLPSTVSLNANDVVLLFGCQQGDSVANHQHIHATRDIGTSVPVSSLSLYEYNAVPPVFGLVGIFANEFRLSVNGKLLAPAEYTFDSATGLVAFKVPQAPTANNLVRIDLEYTSEAVGSADAADTSGHLHYVCAVTVAEVPEVYDTFDDGGIFDDDIEPLAVFDSTTAINSIVLDVNADLATLNVYLAGLLMESGSNYTASVIGTGAAAQLRVFFASQIKGRTVVVTYRAPALMVQIGGSDLTRATGVVSAGTNGVASSNRYGITQHVLNNLAANFVQLTTAFKTLYQVSDQDMQRLIEAAYIAAAGGNPVLTLFYDEFPEYVGLPINAQGELLTAANARAVESTGTDFVDIPYLQDHVISPTVRLHAGTDFVVGRGEIAGSQALLRKRGPDDATPGQWWVPVLILDEQFLSRNFGALVGDLRESSRSYRDALAANLRLRYQGATVANLHRVVCAYLGSPAFQADAKVTGYAVETTGYAVTLSSATGDAQETFDMSRENTLPSLGQNFFPGQSLRGSVVYDKRITALIEYGHVTLSLGDDVHLLQQGDTVRMQMRDPVYGSVVWLTFTVQSVEVKTNTPAQHYVVSFTRAANYVPFNGAKFRAYRDNGAPYAAIEGSITAVDPLHQKYLTLNDGTRYPVQLEAADAFAIGEAVFRGDPLDPSMALVYDDVARPDWYRYKAVDFQANLRGVVPFASDLIGSGFITIQPNGDDYAYIRISPTPPDLLRGTRLDVVLDLDGSKIRYEIGGPGVGQGEYYAQGPLVGNRAATGTVNILRLEQPNSQFLEISPGTGYLPNVTVEAEAPIGTAFLATNATSGFPDRGRCQVTLLDGPGGGPGSTLEFSYDGKGTHELHNLQWGSRTDPANESYVGFGPVLAVGCIVTLVGRFAHEMVNPAFYALVRARAAHVGQTNAVQVTPENAATLYGLLKNSSTVIETSVMTHPQPMLDAIAEATPVGSTTIIFGRQAVADTLDLAPSDNVAVFQTPSVVVTAADPLLLPVDSGNIPVIWLPPDIMSVGLGSDLLLGLLTPPPGVLTEPFTYHWTVTEEVNVTAPATFTDPTQKTLRIDLNDTQSILYVKLKVTHPVTRTTVSSVVRVRRFNTPAVSVVITNPTTGTAYPNNDWGVPSPAPTLDLQAVVDPAVPSAAIGPYAYTWSVIDEALNPAPTILNGGTATPTFTGVANNAVLKVTMSVTATGIPVTMTRAFTKVFRIRVI